jgi:transposase-like protein
MIETIQCEICGSDTVHRVENNTQGFFCTKCNWALVTTYIPEIAQDVTKYRIYLCHADFKNQKHIKALSQIANINFLQARRKIQENKPLILEDNALAIEKAKKFFDELLIKYEIEPDFPY